MRVLRGLGSAIKWTLLIGGALIVVAIIITIVSVGESVEELESEQQARRVPLDRAGRGPAGGEGPARSARE